MVVLEDFHAVTHVTDAGEVDMDIKFTDTVDPSGWPVILLWYKVLGVWVLNRPEFTECEPETLELAGSVVCAPDNKHHLLFWYRPNGGGWRYAIGEWSFVGGADCHWTSLPVPIGKNGYIRTTANLEELRAKTCMCGRCQVTVDVGENTTIQFSGLIKSVMPLEILIIEDPTWIMEES